MMVPIMTPCTQAKGVRDLQENKIPIFDEKRGNAALLIKNSGFYFIFNPECGRIKMGHVEMDFRDS